MQTRQTRVFFPLAIVVAGVILAYIVSTSKPEPQVQAPLAEPPVELLSMFATPRTEVISIGSQGSIQPKTEIDLVAQVSGRVENVADSFVAGGFFNAGETMVQIDSRDYRIEVVRAESNVANAKQLLALERGRARQAKREWRELGNTDANDLFLRKPQLAAAEAAVKAAEADAEKARLNLERTTLSVPFAGYVRSIEVNLGQYVSVGTRIASVFSADILEMRVPLTDRQLGLLPLMALQEMGGIPAQVIVEYGGQTFRWEGKLSRMEAAIDTRSRVRYGIVEVTVESDDKNRPPLVVGQFARVLIDGQQFNDVIKVPLNVMYGKDSLLVLDENSQLKILPVQVLQSDRDKVWVRGVAAQTAVLIQRPGHVVEGLKVSPVTEEAAL